MVNEDDNYPENVLTDSRVLSQKKDICQQK